MGAQDSRILLPISPPNQKVLGLFVPRSALRIATERRKLSGFSRQHIICCSLLFYPTQPSSHTVESAIFSAVSCLISLLRGVVWIPSASSSYAGVLELLRFHSSFLTVTRSIPLTYPPTPSAAAWSYCCGFLPLSPWSYPAASVAHQLFAPVLVISTRQYNRLSHISIIIRVHTLTPHLR
ncbi:hypothetical protein P3342_013295 [Pyrenophora teres f. teres]|nr:hypothetical protein P3342_013295 [Pyrenophora teres f. teres]